ncbi:MAG: diguanylate cyclase [Deltaproteobacteria bacterium]|nr:diguanylate cyclase [Deltaproteobacteria bacterium]
MTDMSPSPQEKLRALREHFARQLPEKVAQCERLWTAIFDGSAPKGGAEDLARLFHTLAGSAPSFGFALLGKTAQKAEIMLKTALPLGREALERVKGEISGCIREMKGLSRANSEERIEERSEDLLAVTVAQSAESRGKLIHILDDDPLFCKKLAEQIQCFGYETREFNSRRELLNASWDPFPAAIIIDMIMQEGDFSGAEAVSTIEEHVGKCPPVIFVSRGSSIEARLAAVKAGGEAYFCKPVPISDLVECLDRLTADHHVAPYRILIIDDDVELSAFYALTLQQQGMEVRVLNEPLQVTEHLVNFNPDLILMDMYMPECNGYELARAIRQMEAYVSIPIVFLSSETCIKRQLTAMRMGGDDFLTKPIEPEHLIASVSIRAERMRVIRNFMERDSLTGLYNRSMSDEHLELAVMRARRSGSCLAFAMIDIDHFKKINDTYGHPTGDRVIVTLARLLQQRLRKTDIVGRYGGEEFVVVLPETDVDAAREVLDQIRGSFTLIRHAYAGGEFSVTFSCGIAMFPECGDPAKLSNESDKALYRAKEGGRNRVVVA